MIAAPGDDTPADIAANLAAVRAAIETNARSVGRDPRSIVLVAVSKMQPVDKLRAAREVTDVQVDQLRGKSPLQFTFNFRWDAGGRQP